MGDAGLEVAAVLVPRRRPTTRRSRPTPSGCSPQRMGATTVEVASEPRGDGLAPRRRRRPDRDRRRGGAGRGDVGLRAPGRSRRWPATRSTSAASSTRAQLIDARQYVLDSEWGARPAACRRRERVPRVALLGRVRRLAPRADRGREGRDQGALRVRLRRLPPHPPDGPHRLSLPRGRVAPQGDRARRPRPAPAARRQERLRSCALEVERVDARPVVGEADRALVAPDVEDPVGACVSPRGVTGRMV